MRILNAMIDWLASHTVGACLAGSVTSVTEVSHSISFNAAERSRGYTYSS
jgi:hypothetical protein